MNKWKNIPKFPTACYQVSVGWSYLDEHLKSTAQKGLDLNPDFQREHVWTREQQIAYIEFILQGGEVGKTLIFNAPDWGLPSEGSMVLVDGKQRLEAVRSFLRGEFRVFGMTISPQEKLPMDCRFEFRVCSLSRVEVLQLYISLNAGGTPHKPEEIERVRALLEAER